MPPSRENMETRMNDEVYDCRGAALITALYSSIEEADSLLELFTQSFDEEEEKQNVEEPSKPGASTGNQLPEDDSFIIREIKNVNNQLRSFITELMGQLESKDKRVLMLKERIAELEEEYISLKENGDTKNSSSNSSADSHFMECEEE